MTVSPGGPANQGSLTVPPGQSMDQILPARAQGVELIGEMQGSGYCEPPALVRRADGQTLQLTRLLYLLLSAIDGRRSLEEIAQEVSAGFGRKVSVGNVASLIDSQLRPLGLLELADGSQPAVKRSNPLLSLRFRFSITDPNTTRRLTAPFARLFHPVVVVPVLAAFFFVCWWVLVDKGLASAAYDAFQNPVLLLLVVAVTVLSAGFHEFGHAAAARYGGAAPGVMGAGLYLFWPAFYTDVTDSYRLGRAGRVRTDLGGLYFNAIVTVLIMGIWWATAYDALLLVVLTQILQMVRQLLPVVRFDGYHVLADLTGVPDLFQRIRPTLLGLLPWRWGRPESKVLKPWARAVVSLWVLIVVPMLLSSLVMMVLTLPRVLATAWVSISRRQVSLAESWNRGDLASVAAQVLMILAVALPILGIFFILFRMLRQGAGVLWRKTRNKPGRRGGVVIAAVLIAALLAAAWWPSSRSYRPIQPFEHGTVIDALSSVTPKPSGLVPGGQGELAAIWPSGSPRPTAEHPQLAMVLVPKVQQGTGPAPAPSWVFPFDKPLPPGDGGNQALAVNTRDGSVVYDVAFALVWVEDGSALNKNEAYAFASCKDCGAVAVAFQVVLIVGQTKVIVPQNLSAAANYNCVQCLSYALASQLVLTLDGPLSPAGMDQLAKVWDEIRQFSTNIRDVPLSEIQARLSDYKNQIEKIIQGDPSATHGTTTAATPSPTGIPSEGPTIPAGATPGAVPSSTPGQLAPPQPAATPSAPEPAPTPASPGSPAPVQTGPVVTQPPAPAASPSP